MINIAFDISNVCITTANEGGMSSFQKWSGKRGILKGLPYFATVGFFTTGSRGEKSDLRGIKYITLGRARNRPDQCVVILKLTSHEVAVLKAVT